MKLSDFDFDKMWLGILAGLIMPFLAFYGYYLTNYHYMTLTGFVNLLKQGGNYSAMMSLCIVANLAAFYTFIWKAKYKGARGVLAITFVWAAIVIYLKFFS